MKSNTTNTCRCGTEIPPVPNNETVPEFCSTKCKVEDTHELADRIASLLEENAKKAKEHRLMLDRVDREIAEADARIAKEKAEKPKKMKVRVSYTVEINPEDWCLDYGIELNEVREDVKTTAEECFKAHLERLGLCTSCNL